MSLRGDDHEEGSERFKIVRLGAEPVACEAESLEVPSAEQVPAGDGPLDVDADLRRRIERRRRRK